MCGVVLKSVSVRVHGLGEGQWGLVAQVQGACSDEGLNLMIQDVNSYLLRRADWEGGSDNRGEDAGARSRTSGDSAAGMMFEGTPSRMHDRQRLTASTQCYHKTRMRQKDNREMFLPYPPGFPNTCVLLQEDGQHDAYHRGTYRNQ